ncbi:hypothetical protein [Geothrix fuzhouensis]|uniref:hypothetical protein n=1 Tax=Geothrix fuzhouensis TaxID=2966451 RepID=UPI002147D7E4|nr:hypothetical protein [Geothrix fuzhouensis]
MICHKYLFNFAASYMGGGRKRLEEYARWFDRRGGAWFIVHPNAISLRDEYPNNRYFFVQQSKFGRFFHDCAYLRGILREIGIPELYYSYGIPIYGRVGLLNWFHVSNVLPFSWRGIPLSAADRLKFYFLGGLIRRNLRHADIISAESLSSLGLIPSEYEEKLILSVNGSDDELAHLSGGTCGPTESTAVVLGTYSYKALEDCYRIFQMLRERDPDLGLLVIGDKAGVPTVISRDPCTMELGLLPRSEVISCLRKTKYYISATRIENSYNAAAEGIFLAEESYISYIGPHRELLNEESFDIVRIDAVKTPFLHVKRTNLSGKNLKSWDEVVAEMVHEMEQRMQKKGPD